MEILILGLILVALMVYASTRIKKTAAMAFERETIETDEFRIVKPEGFLHLIDDDSEYAFQAYSKEFGKDDTEGIRQAWAKLRIIKDRNLDAVRNEIKDSAAEVLDEEPSIYDGKRTIDLKIERIDDGHAKTVFYRLLESNGKVYALSNEVLKEHEEAFLRKIVEMTTSLQIK